MTTFKKPEGWDTTEAVASGAFEELEAGGYILKIESAEEYTSKAGNQMIILNFDIAQGKYKGYFARATARIMKSNPNVKWQGRYFQGTTKESLPFFKGLMTAIEESNPGYKWDWNLKSLENKLFGGAIGLTEWESNGKSGFNPEVRYATSVDTIKKGIKRPEDKLLSRGNPLGDADFTQITDDEIPF